MIAFVVLYRIMLLRLFVSIPHAVSVRSIFVACDGHRCFQNLMYAFRLAPGTTAFRWGLYLVVEAFEVYSVYRNRELERRFSENRFYNKYTYRHYDLFLLGPRMILLLCDCVFRWSFFSWVCWTNAITSRSCLESDRILYRLSPYPSTTGLLGLTSIYGSVSILAQIRLPRTSLLCGFVVSG